MPPNRNKYKMPMHNNPAPNGAVNQEKITLPTILNFNPAIPLETATPIMAPITAQDNGTGTNGKDGNLRAVNKSFN